VQVETGRLIWRELESFQPPDGDCGLPENIFKDGSPSLAPLFYGFRPHLEKTVMLLFVG
jgi:hypothetical protein